MHSVAIDHFEIKRNLKILSWNIRGVIETIDGVRSNKLLEHRVIDSLIPYDVVFIQETKLDRNNSKDLHVRTFVREHYVRKIRKRATSASGGISVFIKAELRDFVKFLPQSNSDIAWLRIISSCQAEQDTYICCCYIPPQYSSFGKDNSAEIWDRLERDIEHFSEKGNIILCGDCNARTGTLKDHAGTDTDHDFYVLPDVCSLKYDRSRCSMDSAVHKAGRRLVNMCIDNNLIILNGRTLGDMEGKYTCHTPQGSSVVDYFLCSQELSKDVVNMKVGQFTAFSDHCPLHLTVYLCTQHKQDQKEKPNKRSARTRLSGSSKYSENAVNYQWDENSAFRLQQALNQTEIKSQLTQIAQDIDSTEVGKLSETVDVFTRLLTTVSKTALQHRPCKKKHRIRRPNKKWFDQECYIQRRDLQSLRNAVNRHPEIRSLREKYFTKLKMYKKAIKKKKRHYKDTLVSVLNDAFTNDPQTVWKTLKLLKESDDAQYGKSCPLKPSVWLDHLESLASKEPEVEEATKMSVIAELEKHTATETNSYLDFPITATEIRKASKSLKNKKAPGIDSITNEIIKATLPQTIYIIRNLFQKILQTGTYPDSWKTGINIPILKSGDPLNPNNYRGITLNNTMGKLFCQVINNRIITFMEDNQLYAREQAGFRKVSRTSDQIYVLRKLVEDTIKSGTKKRLYSCFVDFRKAFDSVWHDALMLKLYRTGVRGKCLKVIQSMYTNSSICTRINGGYSKSIPVRQGVHQGNNLSPTLFNVFINDLPDHLNGNDSPMINKTNNTHIPCLLYADDLVILSTTKIGLQNKLDNLHSYCKTWGLQINQQKTKVVIFSRTDPIVPLSFTCGSELIYTSDEYKYLGIILHKSGRFHAAQDHLKRQANKAVYALKRAVRSKEINIQTMLKLFDTLILPITTYGAEVWFAWDDDVAKSILLETHDFFDSCLTQKFAHEKIHTKFCKFLLGLHNKAMNLPTLGELGRFPVSFQIVCQTVSYWAHIVQSDDRSYLKQAYKDMYSNTSGYNNAWMLFIKNSLYSAGMRHIWTNQCTLNVDRLKHALRIQIQKRYIQFWDDRKRNSSRLNFYNSVTTQYRPEPYLTSCKKQDHRRALCRLRVSAHELKIERGRYHNVKRQDRKCTNCDEIEDEWHFLDDCDTYADLRTQFIGKLNSQISPILSKPSDALKIEELQPHLGQYVFTCMQKSTSSART